MMIETERLLLRHLTFEDAPFILDLLNDPDWIKHIGDRGVRNLADARRYIADGPMKMLARHGFGLQVVELGGVSIGLCGLLKRDCLDCPDLGFALLPEYRGKGYAFEAATGVCGYAQGTLNMSTILAISSPNNVTSAALLGRLKFENRGLVELADYGVSVLWARDF